MLLSRVVFRDPAQLEVAMCLDGFSVVKMLRRMLRPVPSSSSAVHVQPAAADRLERRPLLTLNADRDDVVLLDRSVHRQMMSEMDGYRTTLLHLQQVLLQQQVYILYLYTSFIVLNPLTPTVAIWVQLQSILCQTGLSRHL